MKEGFSQLSRSVFVPDVVIDYFKGWELISNDFISLTSNKIGFDTKDVEMITADHITQLLDRHFNRWREITSSKPTIKMSETWMVTQQQVDQFISALPKTQNDEWYIAPTDFRFAVQCDSQGHLNLSVISQIYCTKMDSPFLEKLLIQFPLSILIEKNTSMFNSLDKGHIDLAKSILLFQPLDTRSSNSITSLPILFTYFSINGLFLVTNDKVASKAMISFRDPNFNALFKPNTDYGDGGAWPFLNYFMQIQGNEDARQILRHWALIEYLGPYVPSFS